MPTQHFRTLAVVGINSRDDRSPIVEAHRRAQELLGDSVTPLSPVGHNFVQSFFVHPSGSGQGREGLAAHHRALDQLIPLLRKLDLDYVETQWGDSLPEPVITGSHEGPEPSFRTSSPPIAGRDLR